MKKSETAAPGGNKLSGHAGKTVDVICEECEILKRLDREALFAKYGDINMPALIPEIGRSLGCKRVGNTFYDTCKLHYHFSPGEWAKRMGYIDPNARKDDAARFSDLMEWHRLFAHCRSCDRKTPIDRERLERSVGVDACVADAAKLLKCKKCGTKGQADIVVTSAARG